MFTTWFWPSILRLCMQLRSQRRDTGKWEQACGRPIGRAEDRGRVGATETRRAPRPDQEFTL